MDKPTEIGKCIGCDRMRRLDAGICPECLGRGQRHFPKEPRKWAEMSHQCRVNPGFALSVYDSIKTVSGKKLFIMMYGLPEGATPPEGSDETPPETRPKLAIVK